MKKVLTFVVAFATLFLLSSCKEDVFNQTITADYEAFMAEHTGDSDAVFFEAQAVLSDNIAATKANDINVEKLDVVFQDSAYVYIFHHDFVQDTLYVEMVRDRWMEDCSITPYVNVTLTEAIKTVKRDAANVPETNIMVFRMPLYKDVYEYPFYIFGQRAGSYVFVDAGTGKIADLFGNDEVTEEPETVEVTADSTAVAE